tara:strand:- start:400 stop:876 length:477 start_codon:yes stop_codon:yes gene_type:complete
MVKRNTRSSEVKKSREEETRQETAWKPPSLLDAPEPRQGMVQRWIATSIQGKETPDNVYKRMRAGWEPRPADTVKDKRFPTINHGEWVGCIGVEGMLLCEMPVEKHRSMKEYYSGKSTEQNESISYDLEALGRRSGLPISQDRQTTMSRGQDVSIMDD